MRIFSERSGTGLEIVLNYSISVFFLSLIDIIVITYKWITSIKYMGTIRGGDASHDVLSSVAIIESDPARHQSSNTLLSWWNPTPSYQQAGRQCSAVSLLVAWTVVWRLIGANKYCQVRSETSLLSLVPSLSLHLIRPGFVPGLLADWLVDTKCSVCSLVRFLDINTPI